MNSHQPVNIVMIEDDEGHARLIEKNIRRAGIHNTIRHFADGTAALDYLFNHAEGPALNGPTNGERAQQSSFDEPSLK